MHQTGYIFNNAKTIGLHTSPIMQVVLGLYKRMGFKKVSSIPDIHGVAYSTFKLDLEYY